MPILAEMTAAKEDPPPETSSPVRVRRVFWVFALTAAAVLAAAAVWMGGLNQDEGWYLYAANLVADGAAPYRDFAFTQGPVMPFVYSTLTRAWQSFGLLAARVVTLALGLLGVAFALALARRLAPPAVRREAALVTFLLLATNLYHLYYLAIPKTYALASLFLLAGFDALAAARSRNGAPPSPLRAAGAAAAAGLCLALAAGTRISLGATLPVVGLWLLATRQWKTLAAFSLGGLGGLALAYGPFLADPAARAGLLAAQAYHAARGGFDPVWTVGSLSRLVRWYLPVFLVLGLGDFRRARLLLAAFLAVFAVQMLAPFPYEDYQVPVMALLAVFAAVNFVAPPVNSGGNPRPFDLRKRLLLVLGVSFAASFGSPLLEKWSTNGQDRFWSLKKEKTELAQLRDVAREIETLDPGGRTLLTQDLYLAIETNRRVPHGLEMGPFAILSDAEWKRLLTTADSPVAALSGYTFAVNPPVCDERPVAQQLEYWDLLKRRYRLVRREAAFGQNATPLLILKRKE